MDASRHYALQTIVNMCVPKLDHKRSVKPFYNFNEDIRPLLERAQLQTRWDFNLSPGDTIKEKYENLYLEVAEASACLRGFALKDEGSIEDGDGWIVTSPEISSIFETVTTRFYPTSGMQLEDCMYVGDINDRWRLFRNDDMDRMILVIGCGMPPTKLTKHRVGVITFENFITFWALH